MDTSERLGEHRVATTETRLHRCVFAAGTLADVFFADEDPIDALLVQALGDLGVTLGLTVGRIECKFGLAGECVYDTEVQIAGDVLEVAAVLEPGSSHGNVVGGDLAHAFTKNWQFEVVVAVPCGKRREQLNAIRRGVDRDLDAAAVFRWCNEHGVTALETARWQLDYFANDQADLFAGLVGQGVGLRVKVNSARKGQSNHGLGRRHEGQRGGIAVVALGEVAVVAGDDQVGGAFDAVSVISLPLADARSAGIGKHDAADCFEWLEHAVALDGAHGGFGARGDHERYFGLQALSRSVACD